MVAIAGITMNNEHGGIAPTIAMVVIEGMIMIADGIVATEDMTGAAGGKVSTHRNCQQKNLNHTRGPRVPFFMLPWPNNFFLLNQNTDSTGWFLKIANPFRRTIFPPPPATQACPRLQVLIRYGQRP